MIQGYPYTTSILPGDDLHLCVSTDAPAFRVEVRSCAGGTPTVLTTGWMRGSLAASRTPDVDWRWPEHRVALPEDIPPGVYVAVLVEGDGDGRPRAPDGDGPGTTPSAGVLLAVRSRNPGERTRILYKLPIFTYHQYNAAGGPTWYMGGRRTVSLHRPGGGLGGVSNYGGWEGYDEDVHDRRSRRQTFEHWDQHALAWLEANGYTVDVCTDLDLHLDPHLLAPYRLLISAGHDEYWTRGMRDAVAAFVDGGGNVAFLGGNTCFRRIEYDDAHGEALLTVVDDWWRLGQPENALTGVGYRNGGGWWWREPRPALGYAVQHARHWVFDGIRGLRDGVSVIGAEHRLIGYEADGAAFRGNSAGRLVPTGDDGTPPGFVILGAAEMPPARPAALGPGPWWSFEERETSGARAATMGVYTAAGGGSVFTAATTDWPRVMRADARVAAMTRNVIDRLRVRGVRLDALPSRRMPVPLVAGGDTITVEARLPSELAGRSAACRWAWTAGEAHADGTPVLRLRLPDGTEPVTVTADLYDGDERVGFGTVTVFPDTVAHALEVELVHALRRAETVVQASRSGEPGAQPALPIMALPRDTNLIMLGRAALGELAACLRHAASLADRIAEYDATVRAAAVDASTAVRDAALGDPT